MQKKRKDKELIQIINITICKKLNPFCISERIYLFKKGDKMSNSSAPNANRIHIAFFGKRNSGKSLIVNTISNKEISIVSDVPGTTTDAVKKAIEIFPIGPCVLIDTAGFDDQGELGKLRVEKTNDVLDMCDIAVLVMASDEKDFDIYSQWIDKIKERNIRILCVINKIDINNDTKNIEQKIKDKNVSYVKISAYQKTNIDLLVQKIIEIAPSDLDSITITGNLVSEKDTVLLVAPQDIEAPKGRLILPQVQTIRELLDKKCIVTVVSGDEMQNALDSMKKAPKLIICDSQVFKEVYNLAPKESILTSFSILFANYKGDIQEYEKGAEMIDKLNENSTVLIAEGCTHTTSDGDIATVKIPNMLRKKAGDKIKIEFLKGGDFNFDKKYDLVIHCGGCMMTRSQVLSKIKKCKDNNIPITNYGIAMAKMSGILNMVKVHNNN